MRERAADRTWQDFEDWCRRRRLRPLPAHPWTLAAYVRWCQTRYPYAGILRRVKAVARRHLLAGLSPTDRHPLVLRTLRLVERCEQTRGRRAALFPDPGPGRPDGRAATVKAKAKDPSRRRTLAVVPRLVPWRPPEA